VFVIKRNGKKEPVKFDKILVRIAALAAGLKVDVASLTQKVISGVYDGIKSSEIDDLTAETAAVIMDHSDYLRLASRITVSSHQKETKGTFLTVMRQLHQEGVLDDEVYEFMKKNRKRLEYHIDFSRDFRFDYSLHEKIWYPQSCE